MGQMILKSDKLNDAVKKQQNDISSSRTEIKGSSISALKSKMPKEYAAIEKQFATKVANYFKNKVIILTLYSLQQMKMVVDLQQKC
jgi:hypothetical protein